MSGAPDVVCDVQVPRDDDNTYVPQSWLADLSPNFAAIGLAVFLLSHDLGQVVPGAELVERQHADDPPLDEMIGELVEAGYLLPEADGGVQRYRLVHPDRLGPLSTV